MAKNEVEDRIAVSVRLGRIATEHVVDLPPVVLAARHLAVAVVVGLAPRVGKTLELVAFCMLHKPKVGVRIAPRRIVVQAEPAETSLEPVLEMELLVATPFALDQLTLADGVDALLENQGRVRHASRLVPVGHAFAGGVQTADVTFDFAVARFQRRHRSLHGAGTQTGAVSVGP